MKTTEDELCDSCDTKFKKVTVTINKVTKCPYCHKYQDDIKDHLKEDQRKKGSCTKCPYSTANLNCLKTHSVQIHEIDKGYLFCDLVNVLEHSILLLSKSHFYRSDICAYLALILYFK